MKQKWVDLKWLPTFSFWASVAYFVLSLVCFMFFVNEPSGDENYFLGVLSDINKQGWASHELDSPLVYMALAYPLSKFLPAFWALRAVNLGLLALLVLYFFRVARMDYRSFYGYLGFFLATSAVFFFGTNDALFIVSLVVFFSEVFFYLERGRMNHEGLAWSGLVVAFFTRELFYVYLPAVFLAVFFLFRNGFRPKLRSFILPLAVILLLTGLNFHSIVSGHGVSYDQKKGEGNMTWTQRQYLAQLMVNEGKLGNFDHPSWEQTRAYLNQHGEDSLPRTVFESILFDWKMTATEFFKNGFETLISGFRQLGLIMVLPFFWIGLYFFKRNPLSKELWVPYLLVLMLGVFCIIIISYVELRWLVAVFIPVILYYSYNEQRSPSLRLFFVFNHLVLLALCLFGAARLLLRFMI